MTDSAGEATGPIGGLLASRQFLISRVVLVDGQSAPDRRAQAARYPAWLRARFDGEVHVHPAAIASPNDLQTIARGARDAVARFASDPAQRVFFVSPGTPVMAACWIILAKTEFPATLVASSVPPQIEVLDVPLDLPADLLATLLTVRNPADDLLREAFFDQEAFEEVLFESPQMRSVLALATRVAPHDLPVLILGETGTGKELVARGIHRASRRATGPFVAVNCGAIPESLAESMLFGHAKGAFTGATEARRGLFHEAGGGTIFLDEVGELSPAMQVRLLRVLQEAKIRAVGVAKEEAVDVRIISATHRPLLSEHHAFRRDLLYRLSGAILSLPPLRERTRDVPMLIDRLTERINEEARRRDHAWSDRRLTSAARTVLRQHPWPGNIRELENTLRRLILLSSQDRIGPEEARAAILPLLPSDGDGILGRPLDPGFDIGRIVDEVRRHYVERALAECAGQKTEAARRLGLGSGQTLANWMKALGMDDGQSGRSPARRRTFT